MNPERHLTCHPEESARKLGDDEGSLHLPDSKNAEILRFAQNDNSILF